MKSTILIFLLSFTFTTFCQAQNVVEIDERLNNLYSLPQLKELQNSNPQFLERLNFYLDHAFFITEQNAEKRPEVLGVVEINDIENFNILQLEKEQPLKRSWDKISVYEIKGTNQILVYHAGRNFNRDFNKHYQKIRK